MSLARAEGRWVVRNCVLIVVASLLGPIVASLVVAPFWGGPTRFDEVVAGAFGLAIICFVPLTVTTLLYSAIVPGMVRSSGHPRLICVILSPVAASGALILVTIAWTTGIAVTTGVAAVFACLARPPALAEPTEREEVAKTRFL